MVAGSVWKVLGNEIAGRGKPQINTIASAVALAVHIPLNLVLVPRIGIAGAALAMSVAYTVTAVMLLIYFRRISGSSLVNSVLVRPGDFKLYGQIISAVWRRLSGVRERPAAVE
jgi:Na+-driven multidrug efflux pump